MQQSEASRINWNRAAALVATIAVVFLFTRSAPFPATTFWELSLARNFDLVVGMFTPPEQLALRIVEATSSFLPLKALYHILYFLICSSLCFFIYKTKETLPGLLVLAVFSLSMQTIFSLRNLFLVLFMVILALLFDSDRLKKYTGLVLIPLVASATGLGLPSWLFVLFVGCHVFLGKNNKPLFLVCAVGGLFAFPEGMAAGINTDSVLSYNFVPANDIKSVYLLSVIFLLGNIAGFSYLKQREMPNLVFYLLSAVFTGISFQFAPVFLMMGMILLLKSFEAVEPMSLNCQLAGIIVLTVFIHLFLFFNPLGLKLNPSVKNQIGKNLGPLMDGYVTSQLVENVEIGELVWKGIVSINIEDLQKMSELKEWQLLRTRSGKFAIKPAYILSE